MGDAARRAIEATVASSGDSSTLSLIRGVNDYLFERAAFRRQP